MSIVIDIGFERFSTDPERIIAMLTCLIGYTTSVRTASSRACRVMSLLGSSSSARPPPRASSPVVACSWSSSSSATSSARSPPRPSSPASCSSSRSSRSTSQAVDQAEDLELGETAAATATELVGVVLLAAVDLAGRRPGRGPRARRPARRARARPVAACSELELGNQLGAIAPERGDPGACSWRATSLRRYIGAAAGWRAAKCSALELDGPITARANPCGDSVTPHGEG
jgi:hypothetical protein